MDKTTSLAQLIEEVTANPKQWLVDDRFETAANFITGYGMAVQACTRINRSDTDLHHFRDWLSEKVAVREKLGGNLSWDCYVGPKASDPKRLRLLHRLFAQFQSKNGEKDVFPEARRTSQMKRFSLQEVIAHACTRPEMYVGDRCFKSLASLLDGYTCGLNQYKSSPNERVGLEGFADWLSDEFSFSHGMEQGPAWAEHITRLHPDDEDALKQLPGLFEEFTRQTRLGSNTVVPEENPEKGWS